MIPCGGLAVAVISIGNCALESDYAAHIMRWSSNTRWRIGTEIISVPVDVRVPEGAERRRGGKHVDAACLSCEATVDKGKTAPRWIFLKEFLRVGMNVNFERVDGISLAFY